MKINTLFLKISVKSLGLNHISNSFSNSGFGSLYSNKYNGKELQETGMFDYGWRQYMPDLGRWNGIDQLAEAYTSISPFAYVANNPISMRDPDGRWMDAAGHIDTSGQANPFQFLGSSHKPRYMTSSTGVTLNPDSFGDGYSLFDQVKDGLGKQNIFIDFNKKGDMYWWTTYKDPNTGVKGIGVLEMLNLRSYSGMPEIRQSYHNFNPYKPDNTPEWYGFGGRANWVLATAAASLENFAGEARVTTTGSSIKLYRPNANGNVFIKNAYTKTIGLSKIGQGLGKYSFYLGVAMDVYGVKTFYEDPTSPNAVHPGKAGLNTVMGYVGLKGGAYGAVISTLYFGVDNYYPGGWIGASETADRTEKYEQQTTRHPFFSNSAIKF
ncbi:hypothetical protein LF887_07040 [Chryseobacterium sp. MEBOG06]|uniref:RHS repeat-associated core domain-containing protein n=1 Tax=Chryseobacterium sp. MEBOG06 TaxID=2879938 RepID=UPI001F16BE47|nr:RHS repeat-associated core domain-containing protein [Chryseobacterium sp. MEBOG06]UKB85374.1 hypothetical protein LF887_07040 [Chryseobacterium sp. MEBOG06]